MPTATSEINGLSLAYEVIGESGQPWAITPGGRFTKESPGVRELAETLAAHGNKVLIWDRPNCGASDVCFEGSSESAMQADALAALLSQLDMTPAIIAGGSGGAPCPSSPPHATPRRRPVSPSGGSAAVCTVCSPWRRTTAADRCRRPGLMAWRRWRIYRNGPRCRS